MFLCLWSPKVRRESEEETSDCLGFVRPAAIAVLLWLDRMSAALSPPPPANGSHHTPASLVMSTHFGPDPLQPVQPPPTPPPPPSSSSSSSLPLCYQSTRRFQAFVADQGASGALAVIATDSRLMLGKIRQMRVAG